MKRTAPSNSEPERFKRRIAIPCNLIENERGDVWRQFVREGVLAVLRVHRGGVRIRSGSLQAWPESPARLRRHPDFLGLIESEIDVREISDVRLEPRVPFRVRARQTEFRGDWDAVVLENRPLRIRLSKNPRH